MVRGHTVSIRRHGVMAALWALAGARALSSGDAGRPPVPDLPESPLFFVENRGQFDERALFSLRAGSQVVWVTRGGITFDLVRNAPAAKLAAPPAAAPPARVGPPPEAKGRDMERLFFTQVFLGARRGFSAEGRSPVATRVNYFIGNEPSRWRTGVPAFREVILSGIYPGIDYRLFARGNDLEQEFIVHPGGDPRAIRVAFRGIDSLALADDGSLVVKTAFGDMREAKPVVFEVRDGVRRSLPAAFRLLGGKSYTFDGVVLDHQVTSVIDPWLEFSSFLKGGGNDEGRGVLVTPTAQVVVLAATQSVNLPILEAGFDPDYNGSWDVLVTRFAADGRSAEFLTYLGGSGFDFPQEIVLHRAAGNIAIAGETDSRDYPTRQETASQPQYGGGPGDAFVTVLDATASSLVHSTYLGGSARDFVGGVDFDAGTGVLVTGFTGSNNFPVVNPFEESLRGTSDVFVAKIDIAEPAAVVFSTYLGADEAPGQSDEGSSITSDAGGNVYVTGRVAGPNFPTTPGAFDTSFNGARDAFVTKLSPSGGLVFSTYLGGSQVDDGMDIAIDGLGNALVSGWTSSRLFAEVAGSIGSLGGDDAFLAVLDASSGSPQFLAVIGGTGNDYGRSVAPTHSPGIVALGGYTTSANFPVSPEAGQRTLGGTHGQSFDGFLALIGITPTGPREIYATYLGGSVRAGVPPNDFLYDIALDACGNLVATGSTVCSDFPTTPGAFQQPFPGNATRAFVSKLHTSSVLRIADVITRPERDIELQLFARSCEPVAAMSLVLELPLPLLPPDDAADVLAGTALEGKVDGVILDRFGNFLSIAILADASEPIERTIDIPEETLIARLRFRAGAFPGPQVLTTRLVPEAGATPIRYSEFTLVDGAGVRPVPPILREGSISIAGFFSRGDANFDRRVSISDIVFILYGLFVEDSVEFACLDAVDANDDDATDIADVTYLVRYLFQQGPPPPAPTPPACGVDTETPIREVDCLRGCP
jgi:hypothetical protein